MTRTAATTRKPELTLVEPAPPSVAERVKAKIAEAESEARDLIESYAADVAALALKAADVAALGKYAPAAVVTSSSALNKTLTAEAMTVRSILSR